MTDDQTIAAAVVAFLKESIDQGKVKGQENAQGLEAAIQSIQQKLYGVYKQTAAASSNPTGKSANKAASKTAEATLASATSSPAEIIDAVKAESLKSEGNKFLAAKEYVKAIEKYSQAIAADPTNAVYYANRAAAYSQTGEHESAVYDAKKALQVNPDYSKAYSRLGHAEFCLGNFENAVDAYSLGLEKEPNNPSIKQSLAAAKAKAQESAVAAPAAGGNGMGGGMPPGMPNLGGMDFAAMMKDPNIMKMAQGMMSNPAMANLLNNPAMASMLAGAGGANGAMPDMASLMSNPAISQMANEMMKDPSAMEGLMSNPDVARMAKEFQTKK